MRKVEVTFESVGLSGFVGQYVGPRGGREIKTATFDEMISAIVELHGDLGREDPPPPAAAPIALPEPTPRRVQRPDPPPPPVTIEPVMPPAGPRPIRGAARQANDAGLAAS
jgi:hypothetical protein